MITAITFSAVRSPIGELEERGDCENQERQHGDGEGGRTVDVEEVAADARETGGASSIDAGGGRSGFHGGGTSAWANRSAGLAAGGDAAVAVGETVSAGDGALALNAGPRGDLELAERAASNVAEAAVVHVGPGVNLAAVDAVAVAVEVGGSAWKRGRSRPDTTGKRNVQALTVQELSMH